MNHWRLRSATCHSYEVMALPVESTEESSDGPQESHFVTPPLDLTCPMSRVCTPAPSQPPATRQGRLDQGLADHLRIPHWSRPSSISEGLRILTRTWPVSLLGCHHSAKTALRSPSTIQTTTHLSQSTCPESASLAS